MKAAMKSGDKARLGTIRLILAAIKQREVDERIELDDAQVIAVLDKMAKQRRESITQYQAANRNDLAQKEQAELEIILSYLPQPLEDSEIEALVQSAIEESGANSLKEMGKVMALLKPKIQGRADMGQVSAKVKAILSGK
ncbi:MAG: glutamyl-tRNA amidotransferase [Methylothermaceae bacteria B42]|nr:MAG: glutamyl-tRNA amidotransferase [Methylothermaceae bacteria B42]